MKYFFNDMKAHAISVDQECSANWVGRYILVQIHDAKFNLDTAEKQAFFDIPLSNIVRKIMLELKYDLIMGFPTQTFLASE